MGINIARRGLAATTIAVLALGVVAGVDRRAHGDEAGASGAATQTRRYTSEVVQSITTERVLMEVRGDPASTPGYVTAGWEASRVAPDPAGVPAPLAERGDLPRTD